MPELTEHLRLLMDDFERHHEVGTGPGASASTGLPGLDRVVGRTGAGGWLIRGGPGAGATALVVAFITDLAGGYDRPRVQVLTADLSPDEITLRIVASVGGISVDRLRSRELKPGDWRRLSHAYRALARGSWIYITDARGWSQAEMELWCADLRPADLLPVASWLVIDGMDRFTGNGPANLWRLERLARRHVVGTTRSRDASQRAAELVTTIEVSPLGHRSVRVDRGLLRGAEGDRVPVAIQPWSLRMDSHEGPVPGPGQGRLDGFDPASW